jgi:hypothetical protein
MPSRYAADVGNLVITDRANRIRRDSHDCERFTDERSELDLESGLCPVHKHDGTDVARLEAFGRNVSGQHHQVVFSNCHFVTPRKGNAVMSLGPRSPASMNHTLRILAELPLGADKRPSTRYLARKTVC